MHRDPKTVAAELAQWRTYCECTEDHAIDPRCDGTRCVGQERAIEAVLIARPTPAAEGG